MEQDLQERRKKDKRKIEPITGTLTRTRWFRVGQLTWPPPGSIKVALDIDMMDWYQSSQETQANFFASEMILPTKLLSKRCNIGDISFEPIKLIAKDFRASLTATAIKFVRLCPEKCAIVFSEQGKIRWFYKSTDWWPFIHKDRKLDKRTLAHDFFLGKPLVEYPVEVDGDAWVESRGLDEIVEHSIASSQYGFVLSLLWIKP